MADLAAVRIGIIGGGAIGGVVIDRLLAASVVRADQIVACEPKDVRREEIRGRYGVSVSADPVEAAKCNLVVLAAPPLEIRKILQAISEHVGHRPVVVSFAGAIPLAAVEAALPAGTAVVRVNPNSPSVVGAGFNPAIYGMHATGTARELAGEFLRALGDSPIVRDQDMNLYTALSAVGPTYFLPVFDAMVSAGLAGGLSRDAAIAAAAETARGCAQMVEQRPESPEQLKLFTGLRPLQHEAVRDLVGKAISDALSRLDSVQKQATS